MGRAWGVNAGLIPAGVSAELEALKLRLISTRPDPKLFNAQQFEPLPNVRAEANNILFDTAAQVYGFDVDALQPQIDRAGFEVSDVRGGFSGETLTRHSDVGVWTAMVR